MIKKDVEKPAKNSQDSTPATTTPTPTLTPTPTPTPTSNPTSTSNPNPNPNDDKNVEDKDKLENAVQECQVNENTECKFNINNFKMVFVQSESYLYRRNSIKKARLVSRSFYHLIKFIFIFLFLVT